MRVRDGYGWTGMWCISLKYLQVRRQKDIFILSQGGQDMRSTDYITVPGWAITELKLSGNELLLYSLIHGYTRVSEDLDEEGNEVEVRFWFSRSLDYVAETLGVSKNTACTTMSKLHDKGLIDKETVKRGVLTLCKYRTKPLSFVLSETSDSRTKNLDGTIQDSCTARHTKNLDHITHTTIKDSSNRNVIKNNITQQPPATPRRGLLNNSSSASKKEDKTKSWINAKTKLLQRYNFSSKVHNELLKFFQMLVESGTLLPDTSVQTQLDELKNLSDDKQYEAIHSTISRGWKSLSYAVKDAADVKRPAFDTATKSTPELKDPNNDRRHEQYEGQEVF